VFGVSVRIAALCFRLHQSISGRCAAHASNRIRVGASRARRKRVSRPDAQRGHIGWLGDGNADIARRSGAALEFSPYVWYTSPGNEIVRGVVGDERMKGWYPVREAIDAGNVLLACSDWPVVPSVNPWLGMENIGGDHVLARVGSRQGSYSRDLPEESSFAHGTPRPGLRSLIVGLLAKLRSVHAMARRNTSERSVSLSWLLAGGSLDDRWRMPVHQSGGLDLPAIHVMFARRYTTSGYRRCTPVRRRPF
jgi:hypothetical protein